MATTVYAGDYVYGSGRTYDGATVATCTSVGSGNWNVAGTWDAAPGAGDNCVIAAGHTVTLTANEAVTYGTITVAATGVLNQATFNLQCTDFSCSGTHTGGVSAGTDLTCTSFTGNSGWTRSWDASFKVTCAGSFSCNNTGTYTVNRGIVTISASGNISNPNASAYFTSLTQNAGVTSTVTGSTSIGNSSSTSVTINGTFVIGTYSIFVGCSATGSITIGANADFTNTTGTLNIFFITGATFTNNRTTAFSVTKVQNPTGSSVNNIAIPATDFSNADVVINGRTSVGNRYINAGTLKCKTLTVTPYSGTNMTLVNSGANIYVSGNFNMNSVGGGVTVTYTRAASKIIYLLDGAASINFDGVTVEEIILSSINGAKSITSNFTTISVSGTGSSGRLISSVSGTQRTITVTTASKVTVGVSFKDIKISGGVIRAYTGNNLGNNTNIIFIKKKKQQRRVQNMQGLQPRTMWTWEGVIKNGIQSLTHDLDQPASMLINNDGIVSIYLRVDTVDTTGSYLREIKAGEEFYILCSFRKISLLCPTTGETNNTRVMFMGM